MTDMGIAWDNDAWEEYLRWQAQDRRILKRINRLLPARRRPAGQRSGLVAQSRA